MTLEEFTNKKISEWNFSEHGLRDIIRETAQATKEAVRPDKPVKGKDNAKYDMEYENGRFDAIKIYEDKAKAWLGEEAGK